MRLTDIFMAEVEKIAALTGPSASPSIGTVFRNYDPEVRSGMAQGLMAMRKQSPAIGRIGLSGMRQGVAEARTVAGQDPRTPLPAPKGPSGALPAGVPEAPQTIAAATRGTARGTIGQIRRETQRGNIPRSQGLEAVKGMRELTGTQRKIRG